MAEAIDSELEQATGAAWTFHLAAFVSIVGALTGALAGGLNSRTVIRHLVLFLRAVMTPAQYPLRS